MLFDALTDKRLPEIPDSPWRGAYERALEEIPAVVARLAERVAAHIDAHPEQERFNSSDLGPVILADWPDKPAWNEHHGGASPSSNAVFGFVVWTVFARDARDWYTITQGKSITDFEQREYFVKS